MNNSITDYYEQSNISDLYAYGNSISENLTNELTQVGNIKDVENRIQITGQLNDSDLVINSYTKHINKTNLIEGRLPNAQSDEIALDHLFMKKTT